MKVDFESEGHVYRIDGSIVPSVTQCLQLLDHYAGVSTHVMEAARQFGQHGHQAMALAIRQKLDWEALDPSLRPYVDKGMAYIEQLQQCSQVITANEVIVASREYKVAGTIDLLMESDRFTDLYEFKFTAEKPALVGLQTAAYGHLLRGYRPSLCKKPLRRWCVVLNEDKVRTYELTDSTDLHFFLSCLNVTHWKWKHGIS